MARLTQQCHHISQAILDVFLDDSGNKILDVTLFISR